MSDLEKPSKDYRLPTVDLTPNLFRDFEEFRLNHQNPPDKSTIVRTALREFLDRQKKARMPKKESV